MIAGLISYYQIYPKTKALKWKKNIESYISWNKNHIKFNKLNIKKLKLLILKIYIYIK